MDKNKAEQKYLEALGKENAVFDRIDRPTIPGRLPTQAAELKEAMAQTRAAKAELDNLADK